MPLAYETQNVKIAVPLFGDSTESGRLWVVYFVIVLIFHALLGVHDDAIELARSERFSVRFNVHVLATDTR